MRVLLLIPTFLLIAACTAAPAPPTPSERPLPPVVSRGSTVEVGPMGLARAAHTATTLPDGRVLVAGGCTTPGCGGTPDGQQAEIFDPATGRFTAGAEMVQARAGHTATKLLDGRVLFTGGYPDEGRPPLGTSEIFDPGTGAFTPAGVMSTGRGSHTATLLADGRVLVVGGVSGRVTLSTVEIFDPASGKFAAAAAMPGARATHGAAQLSDGRVLIVGGQSVAGHGNGLLDTTLLYDPAADSWQDAGKLSKPKYKLAVAALADGGALVIGGQTGDDAALRLRETEIFTPGGFIMGPSMSEPRYKISDAVAVLSDGRVAVAGNLGVEVFAGHAFVRLNGPAAQPERQFPAVAALPGDQVLVTGGYSERTEPTASAVVARP